MAKHLMKYQLVEEWIKKKIKKQELKAGDKLEPENEIGLRFGISRQTVRHALSNLENEGIIESRQGSGNYVKKVQNPPTSAGNGIRTRTITIISTYVNAYIFPNIIQGMEQILRENEFAIRIIFTHNKFYTEGKILESILKEDRVDGLIIEPTRSGLPSPNRKYYEEILRREIPTLFFHSYYEDLPIPHVSIDDRKAGYLATRYLLDQGHNKIGGIFKFDDAQGFRRFSGYSEALMEAGIVPKDKRIVWIDTEDQKDLSINRDKILKRLDSCTACVCYNDSVAHDLTQICEQAGLLIPTQLSLVSIDNSELTRLNSIPLTSVVHPMEVLGEKTANQFLKLLEHPDMDTTFEFEPDIVIRKSVAAIQ